MKNSIRDFFSDLSQTFFIGNPTHGLILFFILLLAAPIPAISGFFSGMISGAYGRWLKPNKLLLDSGLFGMNGFFVGLGFASVFEPTWHLPFWLGVAAIVTGVLVLFTYRILLNWQFPVLVLPYAIVMLLLWTLPAQSGEFVFRSVVSVTPDDFATTLVLGIANGFSEIFYQSNPYLGVAVAALLLFSSRTLFLHAVLGSGLACLTAQGFGLSPALIANGYWGFSGILVAIALGVGYRGMPKVQVAIAVVASVWLMAALTTILNRVGLAPLGLPYLLIVWIFLSVASRQPKRENVKVGSLWLGKSFAEGQTALK